MKPLSGTSVPDTLLTKITDGDPSTDDCPGGSISECLAQFSRDLGNVILRRNVERGPELRAAGGCVHEADTMRERDAVGFRLVVWHSITVCFSGFAVRFFNLTVFGLFEAVIR